MIHFFKKILNSNDVELEEHLNKIKEIFNDRIFEYNQQLLSTQIKEITSDVTLDSSKWDQIIEIENKILMNRSKGELRIKTLENRKNEITNYFQRISNEGINNFSLNIDQDEYNKYSNELVEIEKELKELKVKNNL